MRGALKGGTPSLSHKTPASTFSEKGRNEGGVVGCVDREGKCQWGTDDGEGRGGVSTLVSTLAALGAGQLPERRGARLSLRVWLVADFCRVLIL